MPSLLLRVSLITGTSAFFFFKVFILSSSSIPYRIAELKGTNITVFRVNLFIINRKEYT